jgi:protein-S-isoprenylcysteine O-methyltransferase Ste14
MFMRATKPALLFLFMILALTVVFRHYGTLPWTPVRIAGAALAIPSFVLWFVARVQLGKSFSITPQARELVTHGLYSKIRNPVYLFGSLLIAGIFLYIGKPELLWLFAVLIPVQFFRIKKEEKVLQEKFGETYLQYKKNTWF